jgi:hypothetical protein
VPETLRVPRNMRYDQKRKNWPIQLNRREEAKCLTFLFLMFMRIRQTLRE